MLKKALSTVVSLCIAWTSQGTVQGASAIPELWARPSALPQFQFIPPAALGRISDYYNATETDTAHQARSSKLQGTPRASSLEPRVPLIILIQDLHAHYGVQKNIAALLEFFQKKISVAPHPSLSPSPTLPFAVAVEGAEGPVDNSVLALFPDHNVRMAASDYLMREGELTGADYFAINHGLPRALIGVENNQYYTLNRELFRKTLSARSELVHTLQTIQNELDHVASRICSKHVRGLEAREKAFTKGELSTEQFLADVMQRALQQGFSPNDLKKIVPSLATFAAQSGVESSLRHRPTFLDRILDPTYVPLSGDALRMKTTEFIRSIQESLSTEERADLALYAKGSTTLYYQYLYDLVYKHQLFLVIPPELANYLEYVHTSQTAGMDQVLFEARELSFLVKKHLAKSPEEKDFIQLQHDAALLTRITDLQATESEVRSFAPRMNQFVAMGGTLLKAHQETGIRIPESELKQLISSSVDFYALAMMRNKPIVDHTLRLLGNHAVLVTGGFHTSPITQLLREKNISYIVITPTVNQISAKDHALYVKRLNGDHLTAEEVFQTAQQNELAAKDRDPLAPASALAPGRNVALFTLSSLAALAVYWHWMNRHNLADSIAYINSYWHRLVPTGANLSPEIKDFTIQGKDEDAIGLGTWEDHQIYNALIKSKLETLGKRLGLMPGPDGFYDFRSFAHKNKYTRENPYQAGETMIWIERDGILVIIDPALKNLDHAGRGRWTAYAGTIEKARHEAHELRLQAAWALEQGVATMVDILQGRLGVLIQQKLNTTSDEEAEKIEILFKRYHNQAKQQENLKSTYKRIRTAFPEPLEDLPLLEGSEYIHDNALLKIEKNMIYEWSQMKQDWTIHSFNMTDGVDETVLEYQRWTQEHMFIPQRVEERTFSKKRDWTIQAALRSVAKPVTLWQRLRWNWSLANPGHEIGHWFPAVFLSITAYSSGGELWPKIHLGPDPKVVLADWEKDVQNGTPLRAARLYAWAWVTASAGMMANMGLILVSAAALYWIHPHSAVGWLEAFYSLFTLIFNAEVFWRNFRSGYINEGYATDKDLMAYFWTQFWAAAEITWRIRASRYFVGKKLSVLKIESSYSHNYLESSFAKKYHLSARAMALINNDQKLQTHVFHSAARISEWYEGLFMKVQQWGPHGAVWVHYALVRKSDKGWLVARVPYHKSFDGDDLVFMTEEALLQLTILQTGTISEPEMHQLRSKFSQDINSADAHFKPLMGKPMTVDQQNQMLAQMSQEKKTSTEIVFAMMERMASDTYKTLTGLSLNQQEAAVMINKTLEMQKHSPRWKIPNTVSRMVTLTKNQIESIFVFVLGRQPDETEYQQILKIAGERQLPPVLMAEEVAHGFIKEYFKHNLGRLPTPEEEEALQRTAKSRKPEIPVVSAAADMVTLARRIFKDTARQEPMRKDLDRIFYLAHGIDVLLANADYAAAITSAAEKVAQEVLTKPGRYEIRGVNYYDPRGHLLNGGYINDLSANQRLIVDWSHDLNLNQLYEKILQTVPVYPRGSVPPEAKAKLLETVFNEVRHSVAISENIRRNKPFLIGAAIGQSGTAVEAALIVAAILRRLIDEDQLNGQAYYVGKWALYASDKNPEHQFVFDLQNQTQITKIGAVIPTGTSSAFLYSGVVNEQIRQNMKTHLRETGNTGAFVQTAAGAFGLLPFMGMLLVGVNHAWGTAALLQALALLAGLTALSLSTYLLIYHTPFGPWMLQLAKRFLDWVRQPRKILLLSIDVVTAGRRAGSGASPVALLVPTDSSTEEVLEKQRQNLAKRSFSMATLVAA